MPILGRFTSGIRAARTEERIALRVMEAAEPPIESSVEPQEWSGLAPTAIKSERICGVAGCTSGWMKPWKSRRRPVFEDEWGCSTRCMEKLVASAVARESGESMVRAADVPHQHRVPLGLVLLAQGWITHPQLQSALASQRASGEGRIGDWLMENCGLPEERITRGLGVQWNCPVLSLEHFMPRRMALIMPKRLVAEFGVVPIRVAGASILYVAFEKERNAAVALGLEQMCQMRVESGLLHASQMEQVREHIQAAESVPVRIGQLADTESLTTSVVKLIEKKQPVASRLVRIQEYYWLRLWLEEAAIPAVGRSQSQIEGTEDHIFRIGSPKLSLSKNLLD